MNRIAGLDEAGRGSIIGPLVVAGILISEDSVDRLLEIGVKDSKLLSAEERAGLYPKIRETVDQICVYKIEPSEVDAFVLKGRKLRRLNYLEAIYMAKILDELRPDIAILDASDVKPKRFGEDVLEAAQHDLKILSLHHADRDYVVVGAASIIAKIERDRVIQSLRDLYGDFGSGYPSDPQTIRFLEEWISKKGSIPEFSRRSWKTWKSLLNKKLL